MFAALNSFLTRAVTGYFLNKSLRFRSSASAYLNRTPAVAGNRTTWTMSMWVKRGTLNATNTIFSAAGYDIARFSTVYPDSLEWEPTNLAGYAYTPAVYRDPAAWYHIVFVWDSSNATAANRMLIYVNGVSQTITFTVGAPAQNTQSFWNSTALHQISSFAFNTSQFFDGEMAEINFVDGRAVPIAELGAYSIYNQWLPIKYAGTYGTNGFYLPFTNTTSTSTLVADSSGNANNWTPNNISLTAGSTYDSLTDVPTLTSATVANYAVLNPLQNGAGTLSAGNLNLLGASAAWGTRVATIAVTSGKWYFEATPTSGSATQGIQFGITQSAAPVTEISTGTTGYAYYGNNGQKYNNNIGAAYGATVADNDVVGVAFDVTAGTLTFYKNNVSQGVAFSGLAAGTWFLGISCYGTATASINFGQQPFTYTAPSGFLPLNTFNIPAGTVTTSGTFTGNASTDGPMVWLNGTPTAMTINGNAVTFGTHADKLANGFKVRSSSASYNASGSNTYVATTVGEVFKYEEAQANP